MVMADEAGAMARAKQDACVCAALSAVELKEKDAYDAQEQPDGSCEAEDARRAATRAEKKKKKKKKGKDGGRRVAQFRGSIEVVEKPPVSFQACQGTRDVYPEDMRFRNWLFGHWKSVSMQHGFSEYDAPLVERQELYKRKAGEEITDQMYAFTDQDGYECALRPEMTPSLARLALQRAHGLHLPLKWFSVPQCWRFENTVRGRKREHYQWNVDVIGVTSVVAEVELLSVITSFLGRIGIGAKDVGIKVNSRKVLGAALAAFGVEGDLFAPSCVVIDKLDKIGAQEVITQLVDLGVDRRGAENVISFLGLASIDELDAWVRGGAGKCSTSEEGEEKDEDGRGGGSEADAELVHAVAELKEVFDLAESYGFRDWLIFDASVVRGLAYYTGIVFECFDRGGELRAICGGGRYDRLLTLYGANSEVPACGFGFGDCVIYELLKDKGLLPELSRTVDFVVAPFSAAMRGKSMEVARRIREKGEYTVDLVLEPKRKVAMSFEYADRIGATAIVFVAPDEVENGFVRVKDLRETDEALKSYDVPLEKLADIGSFLAAEKAARINSSSSAA